MRAIVQDEYGGVDRLRVAEVPDPVPAAGEVLVRVGAVGIDRGTVHLMTGTPRAARLALGLRRPKPRYRTPGRDVAGTVVALGPDVTGRAVGDRVYGTADGSCAELAVVPLTRLSRRPERLTVEEAAAVPVSGLTAHQALRGTHIGSGSRVLVVGASGGVGSFAVQLALAARAEVTGVCSTTKADLVRDLGAAHVIEHEHADIDAAGVRYDVVLDIGGHRPVRALRRVLTPHGTLVVVGSETGGRWLGGLQRSIGAALLSPFVGQRLVMHVAKELGTDLDELTPLLESGAVRPHVERTWPLEEAAAAIEHVATGRARGKVVVSVDPSA